MRKLFVILLFAFCAANTLFGSSRAYRVEDIPNVQAADRTRFVSNPDGLLSQSAVYRIDTMLYSLKESGRAQVVVVAVNSIGDEVPFDFLQQLVTRWGVGRKEADDGLGILLVVDQGAIEIQTGYGLEGDLPDALLKRIINNYMLPAFRERDWDRGMTEGVAAIAGVLLCSYSPVLQPTTGAMPGIKAFDAAVFGGIGSIPGAMIGGIAHATSLPTAFYFVAFLLVLTAFAGVFYPSKAEEAANRAAESRPAEGASDASE